jgi:hypothetical protein
VNCTDTCRVACTGNGDCNISCAEGEPTQCPDGQFACGAC